MHGIGVPTWGGEKESIVKRMATFFQHDNVRHIHVRDAESKNWIERHLAPKVTVDLTPDIVCAMDLPPVIRPGSPPIFGFVSRKQHPGEIHWENCRRLLDAAKAQGYKLRHILLGTGPIGEEDREGAKEFDYDGMELVTTESIDDLTRALGECTVLASMKFHGVVVATMYGVPTIGLITTDKFRNFYKLIGREELVAHHTHKDLETRLKQPMEPISVATRQALRSETAAGLQRLAARMRRDLGVAG
jgi:exopolysaccharide biosynthesis predicted pyruvyltransferase EpsI